MKKWFEEKILLNNNKIAFSEANIVILQGMTIYPEYLIHYHDDFRRSIGIRFFHFLNIIAATMFHIMKFHDL